MKKVITKIIITVVSLVLFMMVLPWLALEFGDGWAVTGLWMFAFFTVNPALVIALSIMAGTELRKLWWIPLAISALFPLLFGAAIGDLIWELYVYSAIYLPIGLLAMLGTYFGMKTDLSSFADGPSGTPVYKGSFITMTARYFGAPETLGEYHAWSTK